MRRLAQRCVIFSAAMVIAAAARAAAPQIGIGNQPGANAKRAATGPAIGIQDIPQTGAPTPAAQPLPSAIFTPPSTSASTQATSGNPNNFAVGEPISKMLGAIAARFGVLLVSPKINTGVIKAGELPKNLDDAVELARQNLEPQGWGIVQSVSSGPLPLVTLKIAPLKEAQAAAQQSGPVTSGVNPNAIDIKNPDQMVTHVLPVSHTELLDRLVKTASEDRSVHVDQMEAKGGWALVLHGPAEKVKKAVTAVVALDKSTDSEVPAVRQLKLTHLDAVETAETLNATFLRQGRASLRAVADKRTNTVIVTGPEDQVIDAMVSLIGMDLGGRGPVHPDNGEGMVENPVSGTQPDKAGP